MNPAPEESCINMVNKWQSDHSEHPWCSFNLFLMSPQYGNRIFYTTGKSKITVQIASDFDKNHSLASLV